MGIISQQLKQETETALSGLLERFSRSNISLNKIDIAYLQRLCVASIYAAEQITLQPEIYEQWRAHKTKAFDLTEIGFGIDWLKSDEKQIKQVLRQYRHKYQVHIILNDVCLNVSVADTIKQVSEVSEKLIQVALDAAFSLLSDKHGIPVNEQNEPQQLMILGMGKLGGGELNFSSDIDLIYIYANDGELSSSLSYHEFYIRVGRLLTQLLNDVTEHGFVYRVDLRLRPWGDSGPIVINLSGLENYYQSHGRDWERYALVKARVLTGNTVDKKCLQDIITPFVYRKYHDFNVFSGLGSLKLQIDLEAKKKIQKIDIKLSSGGIREIEFCMQALQILQGGRNKNLQTTSILKIFELAKNEVFYDTQELSVLSEAYHFLRLVENRIQMLQDKQTHHLPLDEVLQERLLISLSMKSWEELTQQLSIVQKKVHSIFSQLFIEHSQADGVIDFSSYDEGDWLNYCKSLDSIASSTMAKHLHIFFKERAIVSMSQKGKQRLNELLPCLLEHISEYDSSCKLLDVLINLLLSIARRSIYLEMMRLHQPLLKKLIHLFAQSQWLAEEVIRFPILLESVLIADENYIFDKQALSKQLAKALKQVEGDVELELDVLRVFKRQHVFQIALNDIQQKIQPLTASAHLSDLASLLLQASYELNINRLINEYGQPQYMLDGKITDACFAVIAYGKLGGKELHYTSDLDVIFLHDSHGAKQKTNGAKSIENTQFFMRLAQKITLSMSLMTSSGRLYEIDARLRPNGASGFLVSSLESYKVYQTSKAWIWEHQALVRANFIAGNRRIKPQFDKVKCFVLKHLKTQNELMKEVPNMRDKMYQATQSKDKHKDYFDVKNSRGGLVDIEFMVQYFVLLNANKTSSLCEYSDNITLIECLLDNHCIHHDYSSLIPIYQHLHEVLHSQVLRQNYELNMNETFKTQIETVKQLWQQSFTAEKN